jgi:signal transduction histidine kinase
MLSQKNRSYILQLLLFFAAYFLSGVVGLSINSINGFATLIWAPAGIALVAVFMLGYRVWPLITLGAFLVNFTVGAEPAVALGIAAGNTLEALAAVFLLRKVINFKPDLERGKDVIGLVIFGAFLSTLIAATIGTTILLGSDVINSAQYRETWVGWWVGDMLGILLIAPIIFIWSEKTKLNYHQKQIFELAIVSVVLFLVCAFSFKGYAWLGIHDEFPRYYFVYPPLIWIALRFGRRGAVTSSFFVAVIALSSTIIGLQGLSEATIARNLIYAQGFVAVTSVTMLTIAAVVAERENTAARQKNLERQAKSLASQRKNLLALSKSKDEFVAITSHQLRTPATAVKQYLGLLLQGYSDPLTNNQRLFLRKANENNTRQLQIIDDLLLTTRLDLGKVSLNLQEQDVAKIIKRAVASLKGKFGERKQKVVFSQPKRPAVVKCDAKHLESVIENLLDNASNYSDQGKTIRISIKRPNNRSLEIIIDDEGVGIASSDFPKLFQKFSRLPNKLTNSVNGTGLGLYFSKKIIELHKGKIKVKSTPDKGSRFTIFLPS